MKNLRTKTQIGHILLRIIRKCFFYLKPLIFSDKSIIKRQYKKHHGFNPNIKNPRRFTEKIQWLKLYDRNPILTLCADKYMNREFVKKRIGSEYLIPLIYATDHPADIPFDQLPAEYFIKTNHTSGYNMIIKNGFVYYFSEIIPFNKKQIKKTLKKWLKKNVYYSNREWEYKNIKPKIIIEELLHDESNNDVLNDYKIHCFDGNPLYIQTIFDRMEGIKENWFNINWEPIDLYYFTDKRKKIEKPSNLSELLDVARKLAHGFSYVRVDLYSIKGSILFGELTFHPYSGIMKFQPDEWDYKLGNLLKLPIDE